MAITGFEQRIHQILESLENSAANEVAKGLNAAARQGNRSNFAAERSGPQPVHITVPDGNVIIGQTLPIASGAKVMRTLLPALDSQPRTFTMLPALRNPALANGNPPQKEMLNIGRQSLPQITMWQGTPKKTPGLVQV